MMLGLVIVGEMHKPAPLLLCFPLLMSRTGRGAIIFMLALPVTNFNDFWTALIAIIAAGIGFFNMYIGANDGPVELKFAEEGIPDSVFGGASEPTSPPADRKTNYEMQAVPNQSPSPAAPATNY